MTDFEQIKKDFPILEKKVHGKRLIYLDSAASSQRPVQMMDAVTGFWKNHNANVARSIHVLADEATEAYENARKNVADFIGADEKEVVFLRNTTEGVNLVLRGWGEKFVGESEGVVTTIMEHHSNFVPWQYLAEKKKSEFRVIDIDDEGKLKEDELDKIEGAKIVAITMASNVLGTINDVRKICEIARKNGAITVIDAAQSAPGMPLNVKELGCDFLTFSGHKMLAPFGVGVLYGRKGLLEETDPFLYGSEMIKKVSAEESVWNELPFKFEAGTPAVDAAVGLSAAIDYLKKIGMDNVRKHEVELIKHTMDSLSEIEGIKMFGPRNPEERTGLVSFKVEGAHPYDIAALLDKEGIAIRSGHHCAMPLHVRLGVPEGTSRASFYIYNSVEDVDAFIIGMKKIKAILR